MGGLPYSQQVLGWGAQSLRGAVVERGRLRFFSCCHLFVNCSFRTAFQCHFSLNTACSLSVLSFRFPQPLNRFPKHIFLSLDSGLQGLECCTYPSSEDLMVQMGKPIPWRSGTTRAQHVERRWWQSQNQTPGVVPATPALHSHPSLQSMFWSYPLPVPTAER